MWIQNNFKLVMIAGLTLILGLSYFEGRKTHKEIKKGEAQWLLKKKKTKNKYEKVIINADGSV